MGAMSRGYAYVILLVASTAVAHGAPRGGGGGAAGGATSGTVQGVIVPPSRLEAPPSQHVGFVQPIDNPIADLRPYDPLPEVFVYLDGGPAADGASTPPRGNVVWQLQSHSFSPPLIPVVTGSSVEIANVGRETHLLYADDKSGLGDALKDLIGPGSSRPIAITGKDAAVKIRSRSSPHLEGRIVPLATRYFARVERTGKFKIEGVPAGKWTLHVWYRDGWIAPAVKQIDVPAKGDVKIDLTADWLKQP
jgi:hypothetical protein